jgi:hypothetical protein
MIQNLFHTLRNFTVFGGGVKPDHRAKILHMQPDFISGVHNYCDRWCERCPLTQRCTVYQAESSLTEEARDPNNPQFWAQMTLQFGKAIETLRQFAAERGILLDKVSDTTEFKQMLAQNLLAHATESDTMTEILYKKLEEEAQHYRRRSSAWMQHNRAYFLARQQELIQQLSMNIIIDESELRAFADAMEVIQWYEMFIGAKIHRALSGLDWQELDTDLDPIQNDANGSAKIALLAIERSLAAWEVVRQFFPEKTDELLDIFVLLSRLQRDVQTIFPNAKQFMRPGFDA